MKKISGVYALIDPRDGQIRYIGQSKNIVKRFGQHRNPKNDLPVSCWSKSLQEKGFTPDLIILQYHDNPIEIEKYWIDRAKSRNLNLLNLHGGGLYPSHAQKAKSKKIWAVDGMKSPYLALYFHFLNRMKNNEKIKEFFNDLSKKRKSLKNEIDILKFEIECAHIAYNTGVESLREKMLKWFIEVYNKTKQKYPNVLKVTEYKIGYLIECQIK